MAGSIERQYEERFEKRLRSVGVAIERIDNASTGDGVGGLCLTEVRLKLDADEGTSVLAIVKATRGSEALVAFVGGPDVGTTLLALAKRILAGRMRWRDDRPWEP